MNGFHKNLLKKLRSKVFRDEYVAENVCTGVAYQIKAIREQRGWTQAYLAKLTGKKQSNIARLEDPDYGKFSLQTLLEIASAFDVWLSIEFVSFGTGLARTQDRSPEALGAEPFTSEFAGAVELSENIDRAQPIKTGPVFQAGNPISAPTIGLHKYNYWVKWSANQTMAMH